MAIRLITAPVLEPVTLDQAKSHLRVDHVYDDLLISSYIEGSRVFVEKFTARALVTQTWELVVDEFPANEILIPKPPLQSVVSIKYDDPDGVEQTLANTAYDVDTVSEPGWVVPATGGWPTAIFAGINAVRIRFVAGYPPTSDSPPDPLGLVPESLKNAMLLQIGLMYAQRESAVIGTSAVPILTGGVEHLMRQYRVALGMS